MDTNDAFAWTDEELEKALHEIKDINKCRDITIREGDSVLAMQVKTAIEILNECNVSSEKICEFFSSCMSQVRTKRVSDICLYTIRNVVATKGILLLLINKELHTYLVTEIIVFLLAVFYRPNIK